MADSGDMEVAPVGGGEELGTLNLRKDGEVESPKCRLSERRKSSRSFSARGRLARARPKSPLMRMVEMRKGGLRGTELRSSSLKGGSVSKVSKGIKGSVGGDLDAIPECPEGLEEGEGGKGSSGKEELAIVALSEQGDRKLEEASVGFDSAEKVGAELPQGAYLEGGRVVVVEDIPEDNVKKIECDRAPLLVTNESALMLAEMDNMLDLCEVQPLQNMSFLIPREGPDVESSLMKIGNGVDVVNWAEVGEINLHDKIMGEKLSSEGTTGDGCGPSKQMQNGCFLGERFINEDYPPLSKELLGAGKNRGRVPASAAQKGKGEQSLDKKMAESGGGMGGLETNVGGEIPFTKQQQTPMAFSDRSKAGLGGSWKQSMAEILKAGEKDSVMFEPDKIKRIGVAGESSGLPSIYFSGADTSFLAEKLGYAVVGKFFHSIPSSQHIQRAL